MKAKGAFYEGEKGLNVVSYGSAIVKCHEVYKDPQINLGTKMAIAMSLSLTFERDREKVLADLSQGYVGNA